MIAVLKQGVSQAQLEHLKGWLSSRGLDVHISEGSFQAALSQEPNCSDNWDLGG